MWRVLGGDFRLWDGIGGRVVIVMVSGELKMGYVDKCSWVCVGELDV